MSKISVPVTNDFCPQSLFVYGTYTADGKPNFGLFCWFSYCWDGEMGVMACIGGEKLTKDRIHETKVFSANLVTEEMLPLADYLGNAQGYGGEKAKLDIAYEPGRVLPVPVLESSPVSFELEVFKEIPLDDGDVFLCKVRNTLMAETLTEGIRSAAERLEDDAPATPTDVEEKIRAIAPVHTTCSTYFSWDGKALGGWGEPMKRLDKAES